MTDKKEPTMRESYLKSRAEFFILISHVLREAFAQLKPDDAMISGLVVADILGAEKLMSTKRSDKREVDVLLFEVRPLVQKLLAEDSTPYVQPENPGLVQ